MRFEAPEAWPPPVRPAGSTPGVSACLASRRSSYVGERVGGNYRVLSGAASAWTTPVPGQSQCRQRRPEEPTPTTPAENSTELSAHRRPGLIRTARAEHLALLSEVHGDHNLARLNSNSAQGPEWLFPRLVTPAARLDA